MGSTGQSDVQFERGRGARNVVLTVILAVTSFFLSPRSSSLVRMNAAVLSRWMPFSLRRWVRSWPLSRKTRDSSAARSRIVGWASIHLTFKGSDAAVIARHRATTHQSVAEDLAAAMA